MKLNKYIASIALAAAVGSVAPSCSSFLEEYSPDLAKVQSWVDLDEILLGQAYFKSSNFYVQNYSMKSDNRDVDFDFLHVMTDEVQYNDEYAPDYGYLDISKYFGFYTWQRDTGTDKNLTYIGGDDRYFNTLYTRINVCNMVLAVIDEQPEPTATDKENKERVKGEALFLRGYYNFLLANLYCEPYVPATASTAYGIVIKTSENVEDVEFVNSTLADSYAAIIEDLEQAEKLLEGKKRKSFYRAGHVAVNLLLSRVYLTMQDWEKAASYAEKVIAEQGNLQDLRIVQPRQNSVGVSSPEMILTMGDYIFATAFVPSSYGDLPWILSDEIMSLYDEDNDLRYGRYVGNSTYYTPNCFLKYDLQKDKWSSAYQDAGSTFMFRTPEAYLTLAEASAYAGKEDVARATLKKFLTYRLETGSDVALSGNALIDYIRDERAREFVIEGHRWFDLRRYTVCSVHPWSKKIKHEFGYWSLSWPYKMTHKDVYVLEENDPAYTLPLPRSVVNFQNTLAGVSRPERRATREEY